MSTQSGSAKIFQFPPRGRFAVGVARDDSRPAPTSAPSRVTRIAAGGSWYHEDAIREAERARDQ